MARNVHLVGSVPLADNETVFRATAETLGALIKRMPDGETGARGDWVQWLAHLVRDHPQFELPGGTIDYAARGTRAYYRVKPGIDPAQVSIAGKLADYGCNSIDRMDIVWKTLDDLQLDIPVTEFSAVHDLRGLVALLCDFIGRRN